ncbi:MAG: nucleotidyltransferase substrate binding protein [Candidatus Brennerbacteria bacterium]|nr:nucleotidyltransferase substrate binding protein [Candidatus Brennerbacteria bacterium]
MKELFLSFKKSIVQLQKILKQKKTVANRDSAIKRFELTFELAWKSIQKFLQEQNKVICRSPKECLREAFGLGLIADDSRWLEALDDRNLTVHTYDEKVADEVYSRLGRYLKLFEQFNESLNKFL